jgi:hypothetical protein
VIWAKITENPAILDFFSMVDTRYVRKKIHTHTRARSEKLCFDYLVCFCARAKLWFLQLINGDEVYHL